MKTTLLVLFAALMILAVAASVLTRKKPGKADAPKARTPVLTEREQAMYFRLTQTFPELVVLAQVALSAILTSKSVATRNAFAMKVADFVLLTKDMSVLAVIELDDASHKTKRNADKARDSMIESAGYRTLRYSNVPDGDVLRKDMSPAKAIPSATRTR